MRLRRLLLIASRVGGLGAGLGRAVSVADRSWVAMFAVRRDWPDGGHDYVGLFAVENRAMFEVI